MRHTLPLAPQFYVTAPQPCPYLEGRMERKLFTALQGEHAERLNNALSRQGFRRSQNVLYRPSCSDCAACMSARIDVAKFTPSKTQKRTMRRNLHVARKATSAWATEDQKRTMRRNLHVARKATSAWATEDQYDLFRKYLDARHADGGMADMDVFEFAAMIEETPIRSRVIEYSDTDSGALIGVSLTDVLEDGVSMVYSFYAPDLPQQGLGTYMILDHIEIAREAGLPYVYLGYWVPGSPKMGYKARFSALEVYFGGEWQPLGDPERFDAAQHPLKTDPIAEQVANISLPDRCPTSR